MRRYYARTLFFEFNVTSPLLLVHLVGESHALQRARIFDRPFEGLLYTHRGTQKHKKKKKNKSKKIHTRKLRKCITIVHTRRRKKKQKQIELRSNQAFHRVKLLTVGSAADEPHGGAGPQRQHLQVPRYIDAINGGCNNLEKWGLNRSQLANALQIRPRKRSHFRRQIRRAA